MEHPTTRRCRRDVDRRGFLKCMAWAGTAVVLAPRRQRRLAQSAERPAARKAARRLHVRPDQRQPHRLRPRRRTTTSSARSSRPWPGSTRCRSSPTSCSTPATSPTSPTPEEFDTVAEILKGVKVDRIVLRPRRARRLRRRRQATCKRFGKGTQGRGLVQLRPPAASTSSAWSTCKPQSRPAAGKGLGVLGAEQLDWLKPDLAQALAPTRRSWSSATSPSGRSTRSGAGARRTAPRSSADQAVRVGHRAERPHPPGARETRGPDHLAHRRLDRVPTTQPGRQGTGCIRPPGGRVAEPPRDLLRALRPRPVAPRAHRSDARLTTNSAVA